MKLFAIAVLAFSPIALTAQTAQTAQSAKTKKPPVIAAPAIIAEPNNYGYKIAINDTLAENTIDSIDIKIQEYKRQRALIKTESDN
ncbi:MAG: hypothetical protein RLZZ479_901 [Bacteroidota bacterium]